jgi:predicted small secreted protein
MVLPAHNQTIFALLVVIIVIFFLRSCNTACGISPVINSI